MSMSQAQVTAAPATVVMAGQEYRMSPLTDRDIGELDEWLASKILRRAQAAIDDKTPPDVADRLLNVAMRQASSISFVSPEGSRQIATLDGMSQLIWMGLRKHHPDLTADAVRAMLSDARTLEHARQQFDRLNNKTGDGEPSKKKPTAPRKRPAKSR